MWARQEQQATNALCCISNSSVLSNKLWPKCSYLSYLKTNYSSYCMNHLRETLVKHSSSFQHCHPSVQSSSKAETFQSSVQGIQNTSLKPFWWEYAPDICSSKNDYSYWVLGKVHSFPGIYYENKYKYYIKCKSKSLHLNNVENLMIQRNIKYCKCSQKKQQLHLKFARI